MSIIRPLKLAALSLCALGASLAAGSGAGAISTGCAGDASTWFPVAGAPVAATNPVGTFPSACMRVDMAWRDGNRVTILTRLKDSAHDGQPAVGLVRFMNAAGQWGSWQLTQAPTGQEGSFTPQTMRQFTLQSQPRMAQYAACRSTSWTGFPTNACGFSGYYPL